jgi:predicted Zn-dependent peptidase
MYQIWRLKNGLTVAALEMSHMASVSVGIWVGIGGRYEPEPISGAAHFIEHMLFKGTRRRSAREISQAVEGIGGYLNAFTSEEHTCFYSKARHNRWEELLEVLSDMFLHSTFEPVEIEKERGVIREELAMYLDQPQHYVHEILNETLWPNQPLGRSITGSEKTLTAMTREQLLDFRKLNYVGCNTLIVIAGNIAPRKFIQVVRGLAKKFPGGKHPTFAPASSTQTKPAVRLFQKNVEQTHLALGVRTCSRHDDRRFALRLLSTILGENMSSRLFQVVREDHGLAYNIYSHPSFFDDTGDLVVSAGVDTDKLEKSLKLILREMQQLAQRPPPASELRRARDYVIGQLDLSLEGTENQMMWIGENLLAYGKIFRPSEVKQRLTEVTAGQIRAVAREFFRPERLSLALVSPLKTAHRLEKHLQFRG